MDHLYDKTYYTDPEDSQDMYSQDMGVLVTELNIESDATFIDVVRGYPHIYAKNLKDFKDKNVRERSWMEIASVMNCSVEDCQKRWIRLRDRFSKERRLRDAETRSGSGSTTGRKDFPLYQNMMFLSEHIQSRKTYTNLQSASRQQPAHAHAALSCNSSSARTIQNPRSSISSPSLPPSNSESRPFFSVSLTSSRNTPSPQTCTRQQSSIPQNISLSRNSDLQSANQQQPAINAHVALSCISSSARIIQNPRSSISPSLSPSSPENMQFSSVSSASSRNTPSPQTNIPLSRNSALLPAHSGSTQPSSHNFTIPATSPQSLVPPQFLSDFEDSTNAEAFSQENISTPKRRSENIQQQDDSFGGWIKKKKRTDNVETNFLKVSSELSSYLKTKNNNTTSNASDVESFGKWISCELGKLPEMDKKQKMEKITHYIQLISLYTYYEIYELTKQIIFGY